MKNTTLSILMLVIAFCNAKAQTYAKPLPNGTIRNMIDSIIQAKSRADSLNVYVRLDDFNMPEGWFSFVRFDSTKREIFWANSYVYKGRDKYLTNYYFFNDKLIATQTSKTPIKNQESKKYDNWQRNCAYWNDSLIHSFTTNNEVFDYKQELSIAHEILKRFKFLYTNKSIIFEKGSNTGRFK